MERLMLNSITSIFFENKKPVSAAWHVGGLEEFPTKKNLAKEVKSSLAEGGWQVTIGEVKREEEDEPFSDLVADITIQE